MLAMMMDNMFCAKVLAVKMDTFSHWAGCHKFLYWKRKVLLCSEGENAKKVGCVIRDFSAHKVKGECLVVLVKVLHIMVVRRRKEKE